MKRLIGILLISVMFAFPLCANADYLGNGVMNIDASLPTSGGSPNYYTDYDGTVKSSTFGYTTGLVEVFCVSSQDANLNDTTYSFYTIVAGSTMSKAAWIADNWTSYATNGTDMDVLKGEAQKAVWQIMGVVDRLGADGLDKVIYNDALAINGYVTNNWIYALSPSVNNPNGTNYQDYLTPYTAVPEPASLLLFGLGLLGLAGLRRKMK